MTTVPQKDALLIEIGCEEIPAGLAPCLGEALRNAVAKLLQDAHVDVGTIRLGVTPRRLLLHAVNCPVMQADREEIVWGPPERVAFPNGEPSKAAEGFARKTGLSLDDFTLADKGDGKARYMKATVLQQGKSVVDIIAAAMPDIIRNLPCGKQMRWQDGAARADGFIRPIRWIVARLGDTLIPFQYAGVVTGLMSRGHRIAGEHITLDPHHPFEQLKLQYVVADREARRTWIAEQLQLAAVKEEVTLLDDPALLDEVTDLTEWPQVIAGRYDRNFLRLPKEVSRVELKHHQRCFVTQCADGETSPVFFAVANIKSTQPALVAEGNERVVNARLADAAFYFDRDPQQSLEARVELLNHVVFQDGLGMLSDQVQRLRGFVIDNASHFGITDANVAQRAAYLCKSDLTTGLVAEFPELQGYMGGIYADMNNEAMPVAMAIAEHYKPVQADDALPVSPIARCIGVAERMDKLLGYFHLGRVPTASADPFGLRRACIGMIRLLSDQNMPLNMTLNALIRQSSKQWNEQRVTIAIGASTHEAVHAFIVDRLLGMAEGLGVSRSAIEAALAANVERPLYQVLELATMLDGFADSTEGQALAAANKRVANIMRKQGVTAASDAVVDEALLHEEAEKLLFQALQAAETACFTCDLAGQLQVLAGMRVAVDQFFNDVMVMADDEAVRKNRLALLARLRHLFLQLADVSCLS